MEQGLVMFDFGFGIIVGFIIGLFYMSSSDNNGNLAWIMMNFQIMML